MEDIALQIYLLLGLAIGTGVLGLVGLGVKYGIGKVGNTTAEGVLLRTWDLLATVTAAANKRMHAHLQLATSPDSDGGKKVTRAEWDQAIDAAVAEFKELAGLEGLRELAKVFGFDPATLDSWLGTHITAGIDVPVPPPDPR